MTKKMQLRSRTAIVTGAASGIGRAVAISLAQRGCNLALTDINMEGLEETRNLVTEYEVKATIHHLDVSDRQAIMAFPAEVTREHENIDVLVNNAGVTVGGPFEILSNEDFEWVMNINFWGVVHMCRAFLPLLRKSNDARLVNVSSIYGIIAPPGQTAYTASKFAVRGFSQSLRHELQDTNIGVTVVHPGGVATNIAENAKIPEGIPQELVDAKRAEAKSKLTLSPAKAGEMIVKAIEDRKPRILVGNDAKFVSLVERLRPSNYWKTISRISERRAKR